jgi:hypothetical protein
MDLGVRLHGLSIYHSKAKMNLILQPEIFITIQNLINNKRVLVAIIGKEETSHS